MEITLLARCAFVSICLTASILPAYAQATNPLPALHINADQITAKIGPLFSGMMTEEINHSYDGGLYAELIQNRAFKDDASNPVHWSLVQAEGAAARMALDFTGGLNPQLATSLRLDITTASQTARTGIANDGYWGIPVQPGTSYRAFFYARASADFSGSVTVTIEGT